MRIARRPPAAAVRIALTFDGLSAIVRVSVPLALVVTVPAEASRVPLQVP
jgi:hypothetical protein